MRCSRSPASSRALSAVRATSSAVRCSTPVFQQTEGGQLLLSWRCDLVEKGTINPAAQAGCDAIMAFVQDRKSQVEHRLRRNEMLLMDNRAVLHARRSFPDGQARKLARCNFFMAGEQ